MIIWNQIIGLVVKLDKMKVLVQLFKSSATIVTNYTLAAIG